MQQLLKIPGKRQSFKTFQLLVQRIKSWNSQQGNFQVQPTLYYPLNESIFLQVWKKESIFKSVKNFVKTTENNWKTNTVY